jgi:hypothetical protein
MIKLILALIALIAFSFPAQARHHHRHHHYHYHHRHIDRMPIDANGNGVIGGRHAGDPHAFCGAEAARYIFGVTKRDLWRAANWLKFPRTSPAPGMAAARNHHVMVLISHVGGSEWLVHDGNSGGHLTREHVRSIRRYTVVNPHV